jgi:hypothetical protein
MERYRDIDFWKTTYRVSANVRTSRKVQVQGSFDWGDGIRYTVNPFLGRARGGALNLTLQPSSRLRSEISIDTSRLVDPLTDGDVFDVRIYRGVTTYQFTERMLFRNILQYNTFDTTLGANLLFTYRVNSGTAFFIGWDDHFEEGGLIDRTPFPGSTVLRRTNRAAFLKLQYLFRY